MGKMRSSKKETKDLIRISNLLKVGLSTFCKGTKRGSAEREDGRVAEEHRTTRLSVDCVETVDGYLAWDEHWEDHL